MSAAVAYAVCACPVYTRLSLPKDKFPYTDVHFSVNLLIC